MIKNNNINSGVYGIYTKLRNNLLYVGNSIDLENRYKTHCYELKNRTHSNKELIKFSDIYGYDNLVFNPIFFCNKEDLIYWETYFIKLLSPVCNKTYMNRTDKYKEKIYIGPEYDAIFSYLRNNEIDGCIKSQDIVNDIYKIFNIETTQKKVGTILNQLGYIKKQLSDGSRVFVK